MQAIYIDYYLLFIPTSYNSNAFTYSYNCEYFNQCNYYNCVNLSKQFLLRRLKLHVMVCILFQNYDIIFYLFKLIVFFFCY